MKQLKAMLDRLRRLGSHGAAIRDVSRLTRTVLVEPERQRPSSQAKQALAWTEEIAQHNRFVDACDTAKLMRVYSQLDRGQLPSPAILQFRRQREGDDVLWQVAEQLCWREAANANVTGLQPVHQLLTPAEDRGHRTVSALRTRVQALERTPDPAPPARPSHADVLAAAGGDRARAAQLEALLDPLFPPEEAA